MVVFLVIIALMVSYVIPSNIKDETKTSFFIVVAIFVLLTILRTIF